MWSIPATETIEIDANGVPLKIERAVFSGQYLSHGVWFDTEYAALLNALKTWVESDGDDWSIMEVTVLQRGPYCISVRVVESREANKGKENNDRITNAGMCD